MNMLKKTGKILLVALALFVIYVVIALIVDYLTEWSIRTKTYDVSYPITVSEGTISEIEKQAREVALEKYADVYLGEIVIGTNTEEGFYTLSDGTITFTYCHKLKQDFVHQYDRLILCDVTVNLKTKEIVQVQVYGNHQLGGLQPIESYLEMDEIREMFRQYCDSYIASEESYTLTKGYVCMNRYGIVGTSFTLEMPNGSDIVLKDIYS